MAEAIGWASLPNIPRVMTEFVAGRQDIIQLLGGNWRSRDVRQAVRDRRQSHVRPEGLGSALRAGYNGLPISDAVEANLTALDRPETLAIVTGQQVGLFGGPLYTLYKALHVVLLAQRLSHESSGPVVPVFWMETADADFGEVNRISFPPLQTDPRRAAYTPREMVTGVSISLHRLTEEILQPTESVCDWLKDLPFGQPIAELITQAYAPGREMAGGFRELMNDFLGEMGLVMADARHPAMTALTEGFWQKALERPEKLNHSFIKASHDLAALNMPLQVTLRHDALPVLEIGEDGIRRRILGEPGKWWIGNAGDTFDDEGLQKKVVEGYRNLTPSALLRPLLQDWLLPTWIYVGGPAEVSYHAQVGACYDLLEIPRPLISPRISLTLIERSARRWLERNNWTVADVIGGREILLARSGQAEVLKELFENGAEQLMSWLTRIERAGDETGVNLYEEIDQAGRKISHQWEKLKTTALHRLGEQDKSRVNHADRLLDRIVPDGMLQERHDSPLYYLAKYGRGIINTITNEVDLFTPQHLAIDLVEQN